MLKKNEYGPHPYKENKDNLSSSDNVPFYYKIREEDDELTHLWGREIKNYDEITSKVEGLSYAIQKGNEVAIKRQNINYSMQHIQVPLTLFNERDLPSNAVFVYCIIKRYVNNAPNSPMKGLSFISQEHLATIFNIGKGTIIKCSKFLVENDYMTISKKQKYDKYIKRTTYYNTYKFESFGESFKSIPFDIIENKVLNLREKEFLCNIFDLLFTDHHTGNYILNKNAYQISQIKNYSKPTIVKHLASIKSKDIMYGKLIIDEYREFESTTLMTKNKNLIDKKGNEIPPF